MYIWLDNTVEISRIRQAFGRYIVVIDDQDDQDSDHEVIRRPRREFRSVCHINSRLRP